MTIHRSTYVFYGVLVGVHNPQNEDGTSSYDIQSGLWELFGEDTEFVANGVRQFMCGAYDRNDMYLVIDQDGYDSKELEPGQRRKMLSSAFGWHTLMTEVTDSLGLKILDGPAWFVVCDEG